MTERDPQPCPTCGAPLSAAVDECPHCGAVQKPLVVPQLRGDLSLRLRREYIAAFRSGMAVLGTLWLLYGLACTAILGAGLYAGLLPTGPAGPGIILGTGLVAPGVGVLMSRRSALAAGAALSVVSSGLSLAGGNLCGAVLLAPSAPLAVRLWLAAGNIEASGWPLDTDAADVGRPTWRPIEGCEQPPDRPAEPPLGA